MKNQVKKLSLFEINTGEFLYYSPSEKQFYIASLQENAEKWQRISKKMDLLLLSTYPLFLYGAYWLNKPYYSFATWAVKLVIVLISSLISYAFFRLYMKHRLDRRAHQILEG